MNSVGVGLVIIMLVSSANNVGLDILDIVYRKSLIYKRKNNGSGIEPCSTPHFTSSHWEENLFKLLSFIVTL